ncbi:hypothetical protein Javan253_0029 [Streptococcus phage Javan253]|uniref:hypothetical protein n=1 Tax=Streptococcus henryi TaxID=439219 RepID=UPI0003759CEB|nr:hypothetical protein [Streptococcus henryi]QBX16485.1 hypothetical protein Javan253_0029 [Streptococcus phage Javan253]
MNIEEIKKIKLETVDEMLKITNNTIDVMEIMSSGMPEEIKRDSESFIAGARSVITGFEEFKQGIEDE